MDAYLQSFVSELNEIETDYLHIEIFQKRIKVLVSCIICDTPARAFVKKVKGHNGYYGCDKCSQRGMWIDNRMTFPEINSPLRTDVAFDEMSDELHHTGLSPFRGLQIGLVSQFPLDYMHLICLGDVKRLLLLWIKGPLENSCRLSARTVGEISQKLIQMSRHVPREFLRKGRSLAEIDRWKASEFRQFLLYTGPVALQEHLPVLKYKHFLLLFVAIYCLCSPFLLKTYSHYANNLLRMFVVEFEKLYGKKQIVYNVYGLIHLAKDAENFGPLNDFSAFVFESFLGKLKHLVRQPKLPLQQVIRRLSECNYQLPRKEKIVPIIG